MKHECVIFEWLLLEKDAKLKVIPTLSIIITSMTPNLHYLTQNQGNKLKIIPFQINNRIVDDKIEATNDSYFTTQ
jgi:hypothetical protein